jgi:hypothetical protein
MALSSHIDAAISYLTPGITGQGVYTPVSHEKPGALLSAAIIVIVEANSRKVMLRGIKAVPGMLLASRKGLYG